jgi:trehalose synthase-fused probable maltokinase
LAGEDSIHQRFRGWIDHALSGLRTRTHGDYHLGQVLWTGKDFMIIDFEGEPARSLAERRLKHSPLRDVAGMLRSFHYAAGAALAAKADARRAAGKTVPDSSSESDWGRVWHLWSSAAFLRAYLDTTRGARFLPRTEQELAWLLGQFLLEKAVYELRYELNNRPDWLPIPLDAVLTLAKTTPPSP